MTLAGLDGIVLDAMLGWGLPNCFGGVLTPSRASRARTVLSLTTVLLLGPVTLLSILGLTRLVSRGHTYPVIRCSFVIGKPGHQTKGGRGFGSLRASRKFEPRFRVWLRQERRLVAR